VNPCLSDDILCDYLDGAIAPKDAIGVSEHMAECATCAVRLRELGQIVKLLGAALDAELSQQAPTERLRARFKVFLNEASAPFTPGKTVSPSLLNFVPGSAPRLLEWLGGSFRHLAFASVMVVSIAIVVAFAIAAWRSGSLKTSGGERATQAVNSTDSTNSQAQAPDQAKGEPASREQTTANNHREHTASARADLARPTHVNLENRALEAKPKESSLTFGEPGETPYVAPTVATDNRKDVISRAKIGAGGVPITISGVNGGVRIQRENLGENTGSFKELAHSFVSDAKPITAPDAQIKTPSSSFAQKPETESQKPNSAQGQNPTVLLLDNMGAFQKVELSPEANSWAVQIITRGGFDGKGMGDLTITSQGRLVWNERRNQCDAKLGDDVLQMLTQTAFSADASKWVWLRSRICADCYKTAIVLQRREGDGIVRTYIAYWDSSTAGKISEGLRKVYDTFMTHKGCKQ
jgi:hypothetical protein